MNLPTLTPLDPAAVAIPPDRPDRTSQEPLGTDPGTPGGPSSAAPEGLYRVRALSSSLFQGTHSAMALDPGKTTGWAYCKVYADDIAIWVGQEEFSPHALSNHLDNYNPAGIIYEDFVYRNRARAGLDLSSVKMIGIIEGYCEVKGIEPVVQQASIGQPTGYYSIKRMKEMKCYKPGHTHAMDAMRHLLYWLEFKGGFKYSQGKYLEMK